MNKDAFLHRLRELLTGIPASEAQEAVQYYEDYFTDAGEENEEKVIEELGSPEKVAATIRKDLGYEGAAYNSYSGNSYAGTNENGGYTAGQCTGSQNQGYSQNGQYTGSQNQGYNQNGQYYQNTRPEKKHHTGLWVVIAICTCFIWGPLLLAVIGTLFGVCVALLAIMFSLAVIAISLIITAIALIGFAIVKLTVSPAGALVLLGGALVTCGIAILSTILVVWMVGTALPAVFRGIGNLWRKLFRKEGNAA